MESQHPDYMRDWIDREQLLERVWYTLVDKRQIPFEKNDLLLGDIPIFYTKPGSLDLLSSSKDVITDYYEKPSFDHVINKVREFDTKDMNQQLKWVESSIMSNSKIKRKPETKKIKLSSSDVNKATFIKEAEKIGDSLCDEAIYGNYNDATWIGLDTNYHGQWQVTNLNQGLYNGLGGIALFLSYLNKITGKSKYKDLALKTLETILNTPKYVTEFTSAFFGQASNIYVVAHFIALYGENERWINYIEESINDLGENVQKDKYFDVLGGSAGVINVLLNVYKQLDSPKALNIAHLYGQHLLKNKTQMNNGIGWIEANTHQPLGGFSHGTSGIAWSLLRLYNFTGKKEYHETALEAIKYDRSLYNSNKKNWADLRLSNHDESKFSATWCHGSAGIGISRILYSKYMNDSKFKEEIEDAISTTLNEGMGISHSLCHGDLGNSELLHMAGLELNQTNLINKAHSIGMHVLKESYEIGEYRTGVSGNLELPGLFLGTSGIGYQFLRLAQPDIVPSVLTLEKPKI